MDKTKFEDKISVDEETGCWVWMLACNAAGYGVYKNKRAHRLSWEIYKGPIPENCGVYHKCDRPSCVNPNHLFIGEQMDNVKDMMSKGRAKFWGKPLESGIVTPHIANTANFAAPDDPWDPLNKGGDE